MTATMAIDNWVWIRGNTFPVREELKELGCRWDAEEKAWKASPELADRARDIVLAGSETTTSEEGLEWKICEILDGSTYTWTQTSEIWEALDRDRSVVRPALYAMEARGIVKKQGNKKYFWKIADDNWRDKVPQHGHDPKVKMKPVKPPKLKARPGFRDDDEDEEEDEEVVADTDLMELAGEVAKLETKVRGIENWQVVADTKASEAWEEIRKLKSRPVGGGEVTITVKKPVGKPKKIKAVLPSVFQHILDLAQARRNILLVGPAGCGKSHVSKLVAEALGMKFSAISFTSGMSETHLLGKAVPNITNGKYAFQGTEFLDRFEYGGVMLWDEMDAGDPNMLLVGNTATSNGYCHVPNRRSKPIAEMHEDFILIATANTFGRGANRVYAGRNQLDEATLDRFRIGTVEMDFDAGLESSFKTGDDGEEFMPPDRGDGYVKRYAEQFAALPYNMRGTLQFIRYKIEEAKTLRRLVSTRFLRDAIIMQQSAGWDKLKVLEVLFQGWSEDELRRIA